MARPAVTEHAPYFQRYIDFVPETDIVAALESQILETARVLSSIDEWRAVYRYAPGKWSIKQVVGHVSDGERVFGYRLLAIARGEKQPLPGFDENEFVRNGDFDQWTLRELAQNLALARQGNVVIVRHLPEDAWDRAGIANNNSTTVRALAYTMLGHERHHLKVLSERYLNAT